uniref:Protein DSE1 n=2 Tax=Eremothecium gossypii (strain ATCC 10895 / CBS 109.51 / FGSC 9923 / NRRL Y-1056) TaxID=284811 RepID=DSE1_EREGS|nr:RecName: Full=Protein DSE1; AltName: Full=Daughter-specific expression protein 1 [Eremothecium gossypii ATCC 10895]
MRLSSLGEATAGSAAPAVVCGSRTDLYIACSCTEGQCSRADSMALNERGMQMDRGQARPAVRQPDERERKQRLVNRCFRESRVPDSESSPGTERRTAELSGFYTTKKLRSLYWTLRTDASLTAFAVAQERDTILISNRHHSEENLKLYQYDNVKSKLRRIQTITLPGGSVVACALPGPGFNVVMGEALRRTHDQLILTGHEDAVVNLIATSLEEGDARIIRRFNPAKYLRRLRAQYGDEAADMPWLQEIDSLRVRQLTPWRSVKTDATGFIALVNELIFIYTFDDTREPLYMHHFPGVESFDVNPENELLLALSGSKYGANGISLLDLTKMRGIGRQYAPAGHLKAFERAADSKHCLWLDKSLLVNSVGNILRVWDIRCSTGLKCEVLGHKSNITAVRYHKNSHTLYSCDEDGYIFSWELSHLLRELEGMTDVRRMTLCRSPQSIKTADDCSTTIQCGNIVVAPDTEFSSKRNSSVRSSSSRLGRLHLQFLGDGTLITLDALELGVHKVQDAKCYIAPSKNKLRRHSELPIKTLAPSAVSHAVESDSSLSSDSTLVERAQLEELHHDIFGSGFMSLDLHAEVDHS